MAAPPHPRAQHGRWLAAGALLGLMVVLPGALAVTHPFPVGITEEERTYLHSRGPLIFVAARDTPPFLFESRSGALTGINIDLLELINVNLGVEFRFQEAPDPDAVLARLRNGSADVAALSPSPERRAFLTFTDAFAAAPVSGWGRANLSAPPHTLDKVRVAVVEATILAQIIRETYPAASIFPVENDSQALRGVAAGTYDLFFGSDAVIAFRIRELGLEDLQPWVPSDPRPLAFAVPAEEPLLLSIMSKGLATITPAQRQAIFVKWSGMDLSPPPPPAPLEIPPAAYVIALVIAAATLAIVAWNATLRRKVAARTRDLESQKSLLAESEAKFRTVAETATDAIISADAKGQITYFNPSAVRIFGWSAEEILGKPITVLMPARFHRAHQAGLARAVASGHGRLLGRVLELVATRRDGTEFPVEISLSAWSQGDRHFFTGILRDVSSRQRQEAERVQLARREAEVARLEQQNQFKTEFINTASHELSTPLTPVLLQLQILEKSRNIPPEERKSLEVIFRNVIRLRRIVRDMVDSALIQSGKITLQAAPCDVSSILASAVEGYGAVAQQHGVSMELVPIGRLGVMGDAERIGQVFDNLLNNAIKFTPFGGHVRVEAGLEAGNVTVRIADTGVGFAAGQGSRLFKPFGQVQRGEAKSREGTGLGLYIARTLVELHGGHLRADSPGPGLGTTITVTFPAVDLPLLPTVEGDGPTESDRNSANSATAR